MFNYHPTDKEVKRWKEIVCFREEYKFTFKKIGEIYGISNTAAISAYVKAKRRFAKYGKRGRK